MASAAYQHFLIPREELYASTTKFLQETRNSSVYRLLHATRPHWYCDPPEASSRAIRECVEEMVSGDSVDNTFTVPSNKSKGICICKFCLTTMACNPCIYLADHLALSCPGTSHELKMEFFDIIKAKEGRKTDTRKRKLAELAASASFITPPATISRQDLMSEASTGSRGYKKQKQANMHGYVMRMADNVVESIDSDIADFFYTEGIPLIKIKNQYLTRALSKIPGGYSQRSQLSYWNLRNKFADKSNDRINELVEADLRASNIEIMISDGWSNPSRHDHLLNIMINGGTNQKTFF